MNNDILFDRLRISDKLTLQNRIVMAPMTRSMASDDLIPTSTMADYYARRSDAGLIVTEATIVSPSAQGYPYTPGLYNKQQIEGWNKITDKVHANGGKIFAQIWHCGRVSHPYYLDGQEPIAPSAIPLTGRVPRSPGLQYGMPREMSEKDIFRVIVEFSIAARNANLAGFDGIELHAANGYLLDQFLHQQTNQRKDSWGGTPENMARILFDIISSASNEIEHVGVRLSPEGYLHMHHDVRDKHVFDYTLRHLSDADIAYVHAATYEDNYLPHLEGTVTQYIRRNYAGLVIANGNYSPESGREAILRGDSDLLSFGRPFISNPDFVNKVRNGQKLKSYSVELLDKLV